MSLAGCLLLLLLLLLNKHSISRICISALGLEANLNGLGQRSVHLQ